MANEITIIKKEDVQGIVGGAPKIYEANNTSMNNCIAYGQKLINLINQGGMTDELDAQCANYIARVGQTLKAMNGRRSGLTQMLDRIGSVFTTMENQIKVSGATIPAQIQQMRNDYAKKKLQEEAERQRIAREQQRKKNALAMLIGDIKVDIRRQYDEYRKKEFKQLEDVYASITLDNYEQKKSVIEHTLNYLPDNFFCDMQNDCKCEVELTSEEYAGCVAQAREDMKEEIHAMPEQFMREMILKKDDYTDRLPSLYKHLQDIQNATSAADAAEKQKRLDEEREKEKLQREEEERKRQAETAHKEQLDQQQAELTGLFAQSAVAMPASTDIKAKVSHKICLKKAEGIFAVLNLWWLEEGCKMSVEDLEKAFKKQITFCNKLADKKDKFIKDDNVTYEEEVKAK